MNITNGKKQNRLFRWMRKIADGSLPELKIRADSLGLHISIKWTYPVRHKTPWDENYLFMKLVGTVKDFQERSLKALAVPPHVLQDKCQLKMYEAMNHGGLFAESLERFHEVNRLFGLGMRREDAEKMRKFLSDNKGDKE